MRTFLKSITAILMIFIGVMLGISLLDGFVYWKMILWGLACAGVGNMTYAIFRAIDKRYKPHNLA